MAEVPALPRWKGDVNNVRTEPVRILRALSFVFCHGKGIAAEDVCDAIQPNVIGELVAVAPAERKHPGSALKNFFGAQDLIRAHLIPQNGLVDTPIELADGRNHADAQPLAAHLEGGFQSKETDSFTGLPNLGPPKIAPRACSGV